MAAEKHAFPGLTAGMDRGADEMVSERLLLITLPRL
ncbi:MAG: hypothetical protein H6R47_1079 [Proteobacteria bacterium]|nr:hypothetical protein [Pseudomonadota bacterium]